MEGQQNEKSSGSSLSRASVLFFISVSRSERASDVEVKRRRETGGGRGGGEGSSGDFDRVDQRSPSDQSVRSREASLTLTLSSIRRSNAALQVAFFPLTVRGRSLRSSAERREEKRREMNSSCDKESTTQSLVSRRQRLHGGSEGLSGSPGERTGGQQGEQKDKKSYRRVKSVPRSHFNLR